MTLLAAGGRQQAERWLRFLARHMEQIGTSDIAWWQLASAIPGNRLRLISGIVGGLVGCFTGALAGSIADGIRGVAAGSLAGFLVLGLLLELSLGAGTHRSPARGTRWKPARGVPAGLLAGLAAGLGVGLAVGIWAGLAAGLTGGLLFGAAIGLTEVPGDLAAAMSPLSVLTRDKRTALVSGTIFGLSGLAAGIGAVLAARPHRRLAVWGHKRLRLRGDSRVGAQWLGLASVGGSSHLASSTSPASLAPYGLPGRRSRARSAPPSRCGLPISTHTPAKGTRYASVIISDDN